MKNSVWIEWIGVWGSGKSTSIERESLLLSKNGFIVNINQPKLLFKFKIFRYFFYIKIIISNLSVNLLVLFILFKSLCNKKIFYDNNFLISIVKSFFVSWMNRQYFLSKNNCNITLWEGEFHLLPLLKLSDFDIKRFIKKIIQLHSINSISFIVLDIQYETSINRIVDDNKLGNNIRFNENQFQNIDILLSEFINSQENLIAIMKSMNLNFINNVDVLNSFENEQV